eukprot:SAG31_NODE_6560_length_1974_cov_2.083733_1_plen_30_part_10
MLVSSTSSVLEICASIRGSRRTACSRNACS